MEDSFTMASEAERGARSMSDEVSTDICFFLEAWVVLAEPLLGLASDISSFFRVDSIFF